MDTVLNQFLETGTSGRTNIGHDQLLKLSGFNLYLLKFYPNNPFNKTELIKKGVRINSRKIAVAGWVDKY